MTLKVHALVKNADNFYPPFQDSKKGHMRADRIFTIASAKVIAWPPAARFTSDLFDTFLQYSIVTLGLIGIPSMFRVGPNLLNVRKGAR